MRVADDRNREPAESIRRGDIEERGQLVEADAGFQVSGRAAEEEDHALQGRGRQADQEIQANGGVPQGPEEEREERLGAAVQDEGSQLSADDRAADTATEPETDEWVCAAEQTTHQPD